MPDSKSEARETGFPALSARESFMCVLRHPSSSPGEPDVQGAVVYQFSETTEIRLGNGETYTFDSTELRAAVAPQDAERRAAA